MFVRLQLIGTLCACQALTRAFDPLGDASEHDDRRDTRRLSTNVPETIQLDRRDAGVGIVPDGNDLFERTEQITAAAFCGLLCAQVC